MAHGDYNCCMICDCKMEYNSWEAETKQQPCIDCIKRMRDAGTIILSQQELLAFIKKSTPEEAATFLTSMGYQKCFYPNLVDEAVAEIPNFETKQ